MKNLIFLISLLFGFELAFSQDQTYRHRNHKLNKHLKLPIKKDSSVFNVVGETKTINHLERNNKFHKINQDHKLIYVKPKMDYNYRELNRKLKKKK
jgi:hypothetical protein